MAAPHYCISSLLSVTETLSFPPNTMNTNILMRNGVEMEGMCDFQSLQANSGMNLKFNHNQFLSDSL